MMDTEQLILLLNNKLNSLNAAIASAMQSGDIDTINSLNVEVLQTKSKLSDLQSQE